jgi:hypothetical protein
LIEFSVGVRQTELLLQEIRLHARDFFLGL